MDIHYDLLPESERKHLIKDETSLSFGKIRTNHMFVMEFSNNEWHDAKIIPYQNFSIAPGAIALHYAQTIFEGAKAFRHADGEIYIFRYDKNIQRLNKSAVGICMQPFPENMHEEAIKKLLDIERDWCPSLPQSSLYIRSFMFATTDRLGVSPSDNYIFSIILSPSGPYYSGGFSHAVRLLISKKFHRAVSGGTGALKVGGNYAASLFPAELAKKAGAGQVLYLDSSNTYIEEAGSMNHYHVMEDGTFIIPEFSDSILSSITSLSVLELAKRGLIKARQEKIRLDEFLDGIRSGKIIEAGGFGTAAVVSPVGEYILEDGTLITVGDGKPGKYSKALYEHYSGIQMGTIPAPEGWLWKVPHYHKY